MPSDARADFMECSACLRVHGRTGDRYRCTSCGRVICDDEVLGGRHLVHLLPTCRLNDCGEAVPVGKAAQLDMEKA